MSLCSGVRDLWRSLKACLIGPKNAVTGPPACPERDMDRRWRRAQLLGYLIVVLSVALAPGLIVYSLIYPTYTDMLAKLTQLANEDPDLPYYLLSGSRALLTVVVSLVTAWFLTIGIALAVGLTLFVCLVEGLLAIGHRVLPESELDREWYHQLPRSFQYLRFLGVLTVAATAVAGALASLGLTGFELLVPLFVAGLVALNSVFMPALLKGLARAIYTLRNKGITPRQLHSLAMRSSSPALTGAVLLFVFVFVLVPSLRYVINWQYEAIFGPALLASLDMFETVVTLALDDAGLIVPSDEIAHAFSAVKHFYTQIRLSGADTSLYGLTNDQLAGVVTYAVVAYFAFFAVLPHLVIMGRRKAALSCFFIAVSYTTSQLTFILLPQLLALPVGLMGVALCLLMWFSLALETSVARELMVEGAKDDVRTSSSHD